MEWPALLEATARECVEVLRELPDDGFSRRANGLEWSCRATLDHRGAWRSSAAWAFPPPFRPTVSRRSCSPRPVWVRW